MGLAEIQRELVASYRALLPGCSADQRETWAIALLPVSEAALEHCKALYERNVALLEEIAHLREELELRGAIAWECDVYLSLEPDE